MRRFVIFAAVIAAVIAIWSGGWLWVSSEIRTQVVAMGQADGISAPKVACASLDVAGYPFRFDVTCTGASLTSGDVTAEMNELRATVLVYRPNHALIFPHGPVSLTDAFTGSKSRIDWASLEISIRLDDWRIGRISAVGESFAWTNSMAGDALIANAGHLEAHLVDIPERHDDAAGLAALAGYAKLAGLTAPGAEISAGDAELELELSAIPDDVRAMGDGEPLRRWQAAGGALKLVGLRGSDEESFFTVTGDLKLDTAGRPEGTVEITSKGLVERVEALVPEQLRNAVLGAVMADGTYRQTLMLTNGVVFSGLLPVGAVIPLF